MSLAWEDRLEIQQLVARYDRAIDSGDAEGWVECFSGDGVWDGGIRVEGRAALLAFAPRGGPLALRLAPDAGGARMSLPLADRVALEALCYRYNVATDERDADAYVALWAPDGCWEGPLGRYEGHAALRRLIADLAADEALAGTRHWPGNIAVEGVGDHATIILDNVLVQATPAGPRLASLSRSEASLLRRDGRWLFSERRVTIAEPVS